MNESWNSNSEEQAVRNLLVSLGYENPSDTDVAEALRQSCMLDAEMMAVSANHSTGENPVNYFPPRPASTAAAVASFLDESFDRPESTGAPPAAKVTKLPGAVFSAPVAAPRTDASQLSQGGLRPQTSDERAATNTGRSGAVEEQGSSAHPSDLPAAGDTPHGSESAAARKAAGRPKRGGSGHVVFADEHRKSRPPTREEYRHQQPFQPHAEIDADVLARIEKLQNDIRSRMVLPSQNSGDFLQEPRRQPNSARERSSPMKQPQQSLHRTPTMHFARNSANVIYAFTGDRQYLAGARCGHLQTQVVERRTTDPVRRGQAMRDLWKRDQFLTQKGRAEGRWRVRQSMLAWDGTGGL
jgi:hypothetical protein